MKSSDIPGSGPTDQAERAETHDKRAGSLNGYYGYLTPGNFSDGDGRQKCGACDRRFRPDFKGQKFCDHACYSDYLRSINPEERFWSKVNKNGPAPAGQPELGNCWLWTASRTGGGGVVHGQFVLPRVATGQRHVYAHRYSWELANGPIPEGLQANHRCDVGICVRPSHLFLGTQADNMADAQRKGRMYTGSANRSRRLTVAQRMAIYNAPQERGVTMRLVREYNVTRVTITKIRHGRFADCPTAPLMLEPVPSVQLEIRGEVR